MVYFLDSFTYCLPIGVCCISVYVSLRMLQFPDLGMIGAFLIGSYVYCIGVRLEPVGILGTVMAILAGAVVGLLTGVLHYKGQLNSLLSGIVVTLGCRSIAARLAVYVTGVPNFNLQEGCGIGDYLRHLNEAVAGFLYLQIDSVLLANGVMSLLLLACVAVAVARFAATELGTWLLASGDNRNRAKQIGLPVASLGILGLSIAGAIAGLGGASMMYCNRQATLDSANSILIETFAAFFLGLALVESKGHLPRMHRFRTVFLVCLLGSFFYQFLRSSVQVLANRIIGVQVTDYSLAFAVIVGIVSFYVVYRRGGLGKAKPIVIY